MFKCFGFFASIYVLCRLRAGSALLTIETRLQSVVVCALLCARLHGVAGKYHLKSAENQGVAHQPYRQPPDLGDDICCYFVWAQTETFFFLSGIVILEGHLPPQRQTSLNSSGRQTVAGRHSDMSSRPPSTIVWLKLAIKIFRQSQFIQTEIKEKDFTFKSLVYRCLTLNVWRVCWLHLWSQSCSPSPPSCPDLLSKRFKGDGIFSISHHVLWKDFALIAKNWTGLEVWFCFCCCWRESLNFNLGRNTCRWRLTAVISWL